VPILGFLSHCYHTDSSKSLFKIIPLYFYENIYIRLIFTYKGGHLKLYNFKFSIVIITLTISLFQGCSGHALQDLIDGESHDNTSSNQEASIQNRQRTVTPSENSALNSISPTSTSHDKHQEPRYIEKSINSSDINSKKSDVTIEKSVTESNVTKYEDNTSSEYNSTVDDNSSFTLQHYVDELGDYMDEKERRDANKTKAPSHTEKINAMPGIGKAQKR